MSRTPIASVTNPLNQAERWAAAPERRNPWAISTTAAIASSTPTRSTGAVRAIHGARTASSARAAHSSAIHCRWRVCWESWFVITVDMLI